MNPSPQAAAAVAPHPILRSTRGNSPPATRGHKGRDGERRGSICLIPLLTSFCCCRVAYTLVWGQRFDLGASRSGLCPTDVGLVTEIFAEDCISAPGFHILLIVRPFSLTVLRNLLSFESWYENRDSWKMASAVMNVTTVALDWLSSAFDAPLARAVIFGVHIDGHLVVEVLLIVVILFLLSRKSYKPPKKPLTEKEIDELCEDWVPEPLHPPITEEMLSEPSMLESAASTHTTIDGKEVVNFASANYLGLIGHRRIIDSCIGSLEKYGVGSCGPRGFYGTIDVHLDCEKRIAKFLGTPDSVLYSYGISTIFSVIPAFCKKGDIIVADEGVHWGVQNGLYLSRSTVVYFKHNDMVSLESTLEKMTRGNKRAEKIRRYIVVEAVYQECYSSFGRFRFGHGQNPAMMLVSCDNL
ncbi:hypothetical protein Taro_012341 [Colocasia esculenta]|uniref:serine C-palmitoyltransferase n=1 Tax=Colocasia esculenta TaxID=4460 RepID=A0A843U3Q3_COLES|nr:hypothetical protein [Colocasia esculenta]